MTNDDDDTEEHRRIEVEEKPPEKINKILPKPNLIQRKPKESENLNSNQLKSSWSQPSPSYRPYEPNSNGQRKLF